MKMSNKEKLEIYDDYKKGMKIIDLAAKYNLHVSQVSYLCNYIERYGKDDFLKEIPNKTYTADFKLDCIKEVVVNKRKIAEVALDNKLSNTGILGNWLKKYRDSGLDLDDEKLLEVLSFSQGRPKKIMTN